LGRYCSLQDRDNTKVLYDSIKLDTRKHIADGTEIGSADFVVVEIQMPKRTASVGIHTIPHRLYP
jgi:hypothetical protein